MNLLTLNHFALALGDPGTYPPFSGEAWSFAGQVTLLGMAMIFSVLALLWGVLSIFKLIFAGKTPKAPKAPKAPKVPKAKKTEQAEAIPDDVMTAVIAAGIRAYQEDQASNDTALVAILTAAVAAYRAEEGADGGFRVVSFKRTGSVRAWNAKK